LRKRHGATDVTARRRVLLHNLCELLGREVLRKPDKRRPQSPMNQRDLAVDEPAHENLVGVDDSPKDRVYMVALWVRPPTPFDVLADDSLRKSRHSPFGRNEDDAMLSDES